MKHSLFITGYPGFLASSLIRQLVKDHGNAIHHTYLLVLPKQAAEASVELAYFIKQEKLDSGIKCPDMKDTIEPMISFYRKYKNDQKKHSEN